MSIARNHDMHRRRAGRNLGVALVLVGFIALVFGLTLVKIQNGALMEAYDHTYRPSMDPDTLIGEEGQ